MAKDKKIEKKVHKLGKIAAIRAELKRVNYPTFKQVRKNTGVVLIVLVVLALFIFMLDTFFGFLTKKMINFNFDKSDTENAQDYDIPVDIDGVYYQNNGDGTYSPYMEDGTVSDVVVQGSDILWMADHALDNDGTMYRPNSDGTFSPYLGNREFGEPKAQSEIDWYSPEEATDDNVIDGNGEG